MFVDNLNRYAGICKDVGEFIPVIKIIHPILSTENVKRGLVLFKT